MPQPELIADNASIHTGSGWNTWSGEHYESVVGAVRNERHYHLITAGSARSHTSWTQPIFLVVLATGMACGLRGFIKKKEIKKWLCQMSSQQDLQQHTV